MTYVQGGREPSQPARVVLLGDVTYENTRLLLLSRSRAFPRGLAQQRTARSASTTWRTSRRRRGLFPGQRLNLFTGLWRAGDCVDDWNADNFDHTGLGFVGGGLLAAAGDQADRAAASRRRPCVPRWGAAWKAWLRPTPSRSATPSPARSLPYEDNYLDLDPVAAIRRPPCRADHLPLHENERRGHDFLATSWRNGCGAPGPSETWTRRRVRRGAALLRRYANGPRSRELGRRSPRFAHAAPNLGIIGASTFPTAGGANPTLTVQALAWRTAQHLVDTAGERLGA